MSNWQPPNNFLRATLLLSSMTLPSTTFAAQDPGQLAARSEHHDSARAVTIACQISEAARADSQPVNCRPVSYRETATEIILRIREVRLEGSTPLEFPLSEVRLHKQRPEAILTRIRVP